MGDLDALLTSDLTQLNTTARKLEVPGVIVPRAQPKMP
jgi:hypothetical protein